MNLHFSQQPQTYLILAAVMFSLGLYTVLTRRNAIGILMGIELLMNAAGISFVTFSFFNQHTLGLQGHVFTLFIIVLAAAESVVLLAIILALFQQRHSVEVTDITDLRG